MSHLFSQRLVQGIAFNSHRLPGGSGFAIARGSHRIDPLVFIPGVQNSLQMPSIVARRSVGAKGKLSDWASTSSFVRPIGQKAALLTAQDALMPQLEQELAQAFACLFWPIFLCLTILSLQVGPR